MACIKGRKWPGASTKLTLTMTSLQPFGPIVFVAKHHSVHTCAGLRVEIRKDKCAYVISQIESQSYMEACVCMQSCHMCFFMCVVLSYVLFLSHVCSCHMCVPVMCVVPSHVYSYHMCGPAICVGRAGKNILHTFMQACSSRRV